jgi:hypothetical protein
MLVTKEVLSKNGLAEMMDLVLRDIEQSKTITYIELLNDFNDIIGQHNLDISPGCS